MKIANHRHRRQGVSSLITALLLVALIGILACALDIGWITMTKTQLHAAADSASLAGGTELLPGLGFAADKTPAEIAATVNNMATSFAAENRAGEQSAVYVVGGRDVKLGTGFFNTEIGQWEFSWGETPYNAVQVTPKRNVDGGGADSPLPLFFAPVIGSNESRISVLSTAVILPANGFRVPPGGGNADLMPFAFEFEIWNKYFRAVEYLNGGGNLANVTELDPLDIDGTPLFFDYYTQGNQELPYQLFDDVFGVTEHGAVTNSPDGIMEFNIFPITRESGNFGTIDVGHSGNSTADLKRQILDGVTPSDLAYFPDSLLVPPLEMNGDTGISAGIKAQLLQILGQCRSIALFDNVDGPGNNAYFSIVKFVGVRVMDVDLTGGNKYLIMQPCTYSEPGGNPDYDAEIGDQTTIFTPLILGQ